MTGDTALHATGAVVIGRNEGERLRRCLDSVLPRFGHVVYVDSGSSDGSQALAASLGVVVVNLPLHMPFTAARARNAGFARLCEQRPEIRFVQFVDGDCEVNPAWPLRAEAFLEAQPRVAAVCGRRRERHPDRSAYNLLCDTEWNTPIGEARAFGGDVVIRVDALRQVGGYRDDLIAGEEPELAVRLRKKEWKIWRLDAEMTLHDAAMTKLWQWWRRSTRAGFAFAQGAHLHGAPPERHWVRETRRAWGWGVGLPIAITLCASLVGSWALAGLALYPLQMVRIFLRESGGARARAVRAFFLVAGKFPEALGAVKFVSQRWAGVTPRLIEYK